MSAANHGGESVRVLHSAWVWPAAASQAPCAWGAGVPRLGKQTPDHVSEPPCPTPQWATLRGVWATAVSQCLEVVGQHACILAPRGDPQVCPHSLPRSVAGQLSSVPGWLPAVPWISPASLLVPCGVTFQMNCSPCLRSAAGEPRRTETAVGLGAPCLPVGRIDGAGTGGGARCAQTGWAGDAPVQMGRGVGGLGPASSPLLSSWTRAGRLPRGQARVPARQTR